MFEILMQFFAAVSIPVIGSTASFILYLLYYFTYMTCFYLSCLLQLCGFTTEQKAFSGLCLLNTTAWCSFKLYVVIGYFAYFLLL